MNKQRPPSQPSPNGRAPLHDGSTVASDIGARLGVCDMCLAHQTCSSCERPYRRHNWAWGGLCSRCVERYRARYLEQDDPKAPFETEWMRSIYPDVLRALERNRSCPNRARWDLAANDASLAR